MKTDIKVLGENNKAALSNAGRIEVGRAVLTKTIKLLKNQDNVPFIIKAALDSPFAPIVVGNILATAITEFLPDSPKNEYIKDAVVEAGALELIKAIDLSSLLEKITSGIKIPKGTFNINVDTNEE